MGRGIVSGGFEAENFILQLPYSPFQFLDFCLFLLKHTLQILTVLWVDVSCSNPEVQGTDEVPALQAAIVALSYVDDLVIEVESRLPDLTRAL